MRHTCKFRLLLHPGSQGLVMTESIVWISGATAGIGGALSRSVPYPNARVINLSRRQHRDFETVPFDLTLPQTYQAVGDHFSRELQGFRGRRAIFIHCARHIGSRGAVTETDREEYRASIQANVVAPLVLGEMFLRALTGGYEGGLVLMSSAAAAYPVEGSASYCAAKAAIEMWVKVVQRELYQRAGAWVVAIRPGVLDQAIAHERGDADVDQAAKDIWAAIPPRAGSSVMMFDELVNLSWERAAPPPGASARPIRQE